MAYDKRHPSQGPVTLARPKPEFKEERPAWDEFLDEWLDREGWTDS